MKTADGSQFPVRKGLRPHGNPVYTTSSISRNFSFGNRSGICFYGNFTIVANSKSAPAQSQYFEDLFRPHDAWSAASEIYRINGPNFRARQGIALYLPQDRIFIAVRYSVIVWEADEVTIATAGFAKRYVEI
jgi:hypothetical protein